MQNDLAATVAELQSQNAVLRHRLTCDSCCGEKTADCICMDSDEDLHGTVVGQRMGFRRLLRKERTERDAMQSRLAELAAENERLKEELDATECSHQDEEAAHAGTLRMLEIAKAERDALRTQLAEALDVLSAVDVRKPYQDWPHLTLNKMGTPSPDELEAWKQKRDAAVAAKLRKEWV